MKADVVGRRKLTEMGDAGEGTAGQDSLIQSASLSTYGTAFRPQVPDKPHFQSS